MLSKPYIVLINEQCHRFIQKIKRGPYVFWNGDTNSSAQYGTVDLLQLVARGKYYDPRRGTTPSFDPAKWTEIDLEKIRLVYLAFREKPRKKAEAKWAYVAEFIARRRFGLPQTALSGKQFAGRSSRWSGSIRIRPHS